MIQNKVVPGLETQASATRIPEWVLRASVDVPGELRGKGRPRFSSRNGFTRAYTDAKTVSMENWIKHCTISQVGQMMLDGPLRVDIHCRVAIPPSWSKRKRQDATEGKIMPTGKPDCDNCAKAVADSLNKIMWLDDSQIVHFMFMKTYAEAPFTTFQVFSL